ncbi:MAG: hypothetical protein A2X49_13165 [Lentisphaerae bacterium GWF2_52_8]|nr:MAG: hypothetical protein A2X49_13165 [Lentisphaerae bacterium GWF2_52_8]
MKQILILLVLANSFLSFAQSVDTSAAKARTAKSKEVLVCSPNGEDGTMTVGDALRKLKRGMTLHFKGGTYSEPSFLELSENDLILEGEIGKTTNLSFNLKGKNAIIRNLWCQSVDCSNEVTIVDSVITNSIDLRNDMNMPKHKNFMHNSVVSYVMLSSAGDKVNLSLEMKNCAVILYGGGVYSYSGGRANVNGTTRHSNSSAIYYDEESEVILSNCILYSYDTVFMCTTTTYGTISKGRLTVKDCAIQGLINLGFLEAYKNTATYDSKDTNQVIKEFKDLRKLGIVSLSGNNQQVRLEFEQKDKRIDSPGSYTVKAGIPDKMLVGPSLNSEGYPAPAEKKLAGSTAATPATPPQGPTPMKKP